LLASQRNVACELRNELLTLPVSVTTVN
jgi:hypothetical protein